MLVVRLLTSLLATLWLAVPAGAQTPVRGTLPIDHKTREYFLVSGPKQGGPHPVVFVLSRTHRTAQDEMSMGFSELAKKGYLVVYPVAFEGHWNDWRPNAKQFGVSELLDDVKFIDTLLNKLGSEYDIDAKRVYAVGFSNGGFMCHRLADELSHRFAAIASVMSGMTRASSNRFDPKRPVSVMVIHGTEDKVVPEDGGAVRIFNKSRGYCAPIDETVYNWVHHNGCNSHQHGPVENKVLEDKCYPYKSVHSGGREGSEVIHYRISGGGHTSPGGPRAFPERFVGAQCEDFNAVEVISEFFHRHAKP